MVYARTDTAWFQDYPRAGLPLSRVRFAERRGSSTVSGASPSVLMAYGEEACRALADSTLKGRYFRL